MNIENWKNDKLIKKSLSYIINFNKKQIWDLISQETGHGFMLPSMMNTLVDISIPLSAHQLCSCFLYTCKYSTFINVIINFVLDMVFI